MTDSAPVLYQVKVEPVPLRRSHEFLESGLSALGSRAAVDETKAPRYAVHVCVHGQRRPSKSKEQHTAGGLLTDTSERREVLAGSPHLHRVQEGEVQGPVLTHKPHKYLFDAG